MANTSGRCLPADRETLALHSPALFASVIDRKTATPSIGRVDEQRELLLHAGARADPGVAARDRFRRRSAWPGRTRAGRVPVAAGMAALPARPVHHRLARRYVVIGRLRAPLIAALIAVRRVRGGARRTSAARSRPQQTCRSCVLAIGCGTAVLFLKTAARSRRTADCAGRDSSRTTGPVLQPSSTTAASPASPPASTCARISHLHRSGEQRTCRSYNGSYTRMHRMNRLRSRTTRLALGAAVFAAATALPLAAAKQAAPAGTVIRRSTARSTTVR